MVIEKERQRDRDREGQRRREAGRVVLHENEYCDYRLINGKHSLYSGRENDQKLLKLYFCYLCSRIYCVGTH